MIDITTKESFSESYSKINEFRRKNLEETANTQEKKDLYENGISIVSGVFTKEDLKPMIEFQADVERSLGDSLKCGGYIDFFHKFGRLFPHLTEVRPNHGQVRVQTKSMPFEMPGFRTLKGHSFLKEMFSWWHQDEGEITRGTMEWIVPSDINHNGWHKDCVRPQLKAFVLLGDVDHDTAPMYYAKKSHFISNDFEKEVAYRLFKDGTALIPPTSSRWSGKHYVSIAGGHSGYLSDDEAKNDPEEICGSPVVLGGVKYNKTVCTGRLGDVIFFDSCGFHSGNRSNGKIRRTIALTSHSNRSSLAVAFDEHGTKTV